MSVHPVIPVEERPTGGKQFPMTGQNIVCFAKDWTEDPTSNNHLMLQLAKHNRVLWLNSISMRKPNIGKSDLGKMVRKLLEFCRGPVQVQEKLYVYTPITFPFPHSSLAVAANRWILKLTVAVLKRRLRMQQFQLWTFLPNVVDYVGHLGESLVVYYCVDEWSKFSYIDGAAMARSEEELCRRADLVFATANSLVEKRKEFNIETHLASHGVDYQHFATALDADLPVADELVEMPEPIIGFYGLIQDWIDLNLIAFLAERHPEWSIVLVGGCRVDVDKIASYSNVHLLGRRPYSDLPRYCKGFQVAIIPFKVNELTRHINPIKLREYLSAGLPVVSTEMPEVARYSAVVKIASSYSEFEHAVLQYVATDSVEARKRRSAAVSSETWEEKVAEIAGRVQRVLDQKLVTK